MRKLDGINRLVLRMDMLIIIRGILGLCFIVRVYPPPPSFSLFLPSWGVSNLDD